VTTTAPSPSLPARVANAPTKPTVLYDGRCRICTASADRIRAHDPTHTLDVISLHEPQVAARFPEITREAVLEEMHLVQLDGQIVRGADSLRALLRLLPSRLRWLALAWYFPGFAPLARVGYRWLARNRYRWNKTTCDGDVCRIHR
jgi:predicted DCC family thiol-disulfide oxidoreductase YuxK